MIFTTCRKTEIRLVRGCTHTLILQVNGPEGGIYEMQAGDVIRFGVKFDESSGSCLVKKEITELDNGYARIVLEPEDTIGMEPGEYKYDIGLQSGDMYFPVIHYSDFILEPNITRKE